MKELLDRLHLIMTGIRATEILDDSLQEGTPGTGTLEGVTVFAGWNNLLTDLSDEYYPYLVLEPSSIQQSNSPMGKAIEGVNISFGTLVEGEHGALFGRNDTGEKGILDWVDTVKTLLLNDVKLTNAGELSPYTCDIETQRVDTFLGADETGQQFYRGFDLPVIYYRPDWTGL